MLHLSISKPTASEVQIQAGVLELYDAYPYRIMAANKQIDSYFSKQHSVSEFGLILKNPRPNFAVDERSRTSNLPGKHRHTHQHWTYYY